MRQDRQLDRSQHVCPSYPHPQAARLTCEQDPEQDPELSQELPQELPQTTLLAHAPQVGHQEGHDDPGDLLPWWLRARFPRLYATGHTDDPLVICRFVLVDVTWSWYALEFDGDNLFFGLVDTFQRELRYFALRELRAMRGPSGVLVERDIHFAPTRFSTVRAALQSAPAEGDHAR